VSRRMIATIEAQDGGVRAAHVALPFEEAWVRDVRQHESRVRVPAAAL